MTGGAGQAPVDDLVGANLRAVRARDDLGLPVAGLIAIPPENEEPSSHFALLDEIARRNGLDRLSMGISADHESAVQFGTTGERVSRALFGERPPKARSTA